MATIPQYDKTIAIVGGSSKTSESLLRYFTLEKKYRIICFSSEETLNEKYPIHDFFNFSCLQMKEIRDALVYLKPDVIINTSGLNAEQTQITEKKTAWNLNVGVVENLVKVARIIESHFVMISTDRVFDGVKGPYSESDKPLPSSNFGKNKLAAENFAISGAEKVSIVRVSGIFGFSTYNRQDFIGRIVESLNNDQSITLDNHIRYTPISALDLVLVISKIISKRKFGVYNAGSSDLITDYQAGKIIAGVYGKNLELVKEAESAKPKASNYGLITLKTETDLGVKMPAFESSIVTYKTLSLGNKPIKLLI